MIKIKSSTQGAALFITLFTVMVIIILANIILGVMLNNSRLTRHRVGRIQAYYADLAGVNYALDRLRLGTDPLFPLLAPAVPPANYIVNICNTNAACNITLPAGMVCHINEPAFPCNVRFVTIRVDGPTAAGNPHTINASSDYAYTP